MTLDIELFRRLCETPGIPGREERVRAVIEKTVLGKAGGGLFDTSHVDAMGSLICTRNATKGGGSRGARCVALGAGTRYIHTSTEMLDKADLEAVIDLLAAWLPTIA